MIRITHGMTIADILFAVLDTFMPKGSYKARDVFGIDQAHFLVESLFAGKIKEDDVRDVCRRVAEYKYNSDMSYELMMTSEIMMLSSRIKMEEMEKEFGPLPF